MRGGRLAAIGIAAIIALLTAGCGQEPALKHAPPGSNTTTGVPSPQATAGNPAAWLARGATRVPPANIADVSLGSIQVVNQTNGAVSDADAGRWALAYLRANAYELWAWNNQQDAFLLRAGLSQIPQQAFGYDITTIQQARKAGVQLSVTRLTLRRLVLRPVPDALRQTITTQLYLWTPYAFYMDQLGPSQLTWIDRQGNRTVKASKAAGAGSPELVGGQVATDPLLGDIWLVQSDFDCTAPNVRTLFGGLCNP